MDHVQAVVEVLAEGLVADGLLEVLVGGRHEAQVGHLGDLAAHRLVFAFLDSLKSLVCKGMPRSPISSRKMVPSWASSTSPPCSCSAGEGAPDVAEEFAFDHLFGNGGAVDGHELLVTAQAVGVDGPGHQLLASAGGAGDEHGGVGGAHLFDAFHDLAQGGVLPTMAAPPSFSARAWRRERFSSTMACQLKTFSMVRTMRSFLKGLVMVVVGSQADALHPVSTAA